MSWPRIGSLRGRRRVPRPRLLALLVLAGALVLAGCTATAASSSTPAPEADVKPSALALQQQFVQVVKQVGPSVVLIQTNQGLGSGIVFDANGNPLGLQSSVTEEIVSALGRITAVDGTATPDPATLADVLAGLDPGQAVTVAVAGPDGAKQTVRVTLGQLPG
jgi:S1-C subfamily serine protease